MTTNLSSLPLLPLTLFISSRNFQDQNPRHSAPLCTITFSYQSFACGSCIFPPWPVTHLSSHLNLFCNVPSTSSQEWKVDFHLKTTVCLKLLWTWPQCSLWLTHREEYADFLLPNIAFRSLSHYLSIAANPVSFQIHTLHQHYFLPALFADIMGFHFFLSQLSIFAHF